MNRLEALRLMVAAQDDPVLAAWAWVVNEYKAQPESDVVHLEHWEAYCSLYSLGFVSPAEFNQYNQGRTGLHRYRPSPGDVQQVLGNLARLPIHLEEKVNKTRPPMDPFAPSSSLAVQSPSSGLASRPSPNQLNRKLAPTELSAFSPGREVMLGGQGGQQPRSLAAMGGSVQAFAAPRATPQPTRKIDDHIYRGGMNIDLEMKCCGHELAIEEIHCESYDSDVVPEGEFALVEYSFEAQCNLCGAHFHCSGSKPVPRDSF